MPLATWPRPDPTRHRRFVPALHGYTRTPPRPPHPAVDTCLGHWKTETPRARRARAQVIAFPAPSTRQLNGERLLFSRTRRPQRGRSAPPPHAVHGSRTGGLLQALTWRGNQQSPVAAVPPPKTVAVRPAPAPAPGRETRPPEIADRA